MADSHSDGNGLTRRSTLRTLGGAGAGVGAFALAGCTEDGGGGNDGNGDGGSGGSGGGNTELSGEIRISGSSTVYKIAAPVTELFKEEYPQVDTPLSRDGSSGGFDTAFIPGDSDINNSSRPITDDEVQRCRDNGFEPVEFEVAKDALTVIVNNENDWVDAMTYDDLEAIWTPDDPPELWSDVRDEWPDEQLDLYGAASTSGTFDYFTETVLGEVGRIREDFTGTEEDDQIATGVEGNQYALGYLPFAFYRSNDERAKALDVAESTLEDAVSPSLDGASTGNYPLARPLFFYANDNRVREKNHLQEFIQFYIDKSTDKQLIADEIGYVQSSEQQAETNRSRLEAAIDDEYEFERTG